MRHLYLILIALLAAGCADHPLDALLAKPASQPAGLAVSYSLSANAAQQLARTPADAAHVRLAQGGTTVFEETFPLSADSEETRLSIELEMQGEQQMFDLFIELLADGRVLARGESSVAVRRGEENTAQVVADALFGGVATGASHSCHLAADGRAFCWGSNSDGQLGDGTLVSSAVPVAVAGGVTFTDVSAAGHRTCGLSTDGRVFCWGANGFGQLANGTSGQPNPQPAPIAGGQRFASLSVGFRHACALTEAGEAYCWGWNDKGQLGATTAETCVQNAPCSTSPVAVQGGLVFEQIEAGFWHTCGLTTSGESYCWGTNGWGQLGTGTPGQGGSTPVQVTGGQSFVELMAGTVHTCGLTEAGEAYCWGDNLMGQLGDGTTTAQAAPTAVAGGQRFRSLQAHKENSIFGSICGIAEDGSTFCWGSNHQGALGIQSAGECAFNGNMISCALTPTAAAGGLDLQAVDLGTSHGCGVTEQGDTFCWGAVGMGQLGNGTMLAETTPTAVAGGRTFASVTAGRFDHSCGLAPDGSAYCWGSNSYGELGDGTEQQSGVPVAVQGGPFASLKAGGSFTCARDDAQQAFCWGRNSHGQLGDGTTTSRSTPAPVTGGVSFAALEPSYYWVSAIAADAQASAYFWGAGGEGDARNNPTPVNTGLTGIHEQAAGWAHTCYLDAAGSASCRGENAAGQLGDGTNTFQPSPVPVQGGLTFESIHAGQSHTCALTPDGSAHCWGSNQDGQLGDGTKTDSNVPVAVTGGLRFAQLSTGGFHTCGVTAEGAAYCWGSGGAGRLGNGALVGSTAPVAVTGGHSWSWLSAGGAHTCGVTTAGEALCWGYNGSAQIGSGTVELFTSTPVAVGGGGAMSGSRSPNWSRMFQRPSRSRTAPVSAPVILEERSAYDRSFLRMD